MQYNAINYSIKSRDRNLRMIETIRHFWRLWDKDGLGIFCWAKILIYNNNNIITIISFGQLLCTGASDVKL